MKNKVRNYLIVIAIIILIIIGLVTLNTTGLLKKKSESVEQITQQEAMQKLEEALQTASTQKENESSYNSEEYLTALLKGQNIIVNENIVAVDGYNFEIDRENLTITQNLGKSQVTVANEIVEVLGKNDNGKYRAKVKITITSNVPIDNMIFQNENGTFSKEKTTQLTYVKEMEIELDKEYVLTVATADGKLNTSKIYQSSDIIPTVTPGTSHTAATLTYSWEELNLIAELISDNDETITNDTAEATVTKDGTTYVVGVGDTVAVTYNGKSYMVRILGFNHDELVSNTAYGEGKSNLTAGISFEFVNVLYSAEMDEQLLKRMGKHGITK